MNAIIFDLDGVLCHTDEYHYMAWKAIADELHIPFNREVNNQLRGVSRMESLKLILRNSPVCYSEQEKVLLAEKKNNIYRELLQNITSKDLADGAWAVLEKLHAVHIPLAIGSSSKNTPLIVEKLGIGKDRAYALMKNKTFPSFKIGSSYFVEQTKLDEKGRAVFDADGEPVKEKVEVTIRAFKVVKTFDLSQTDGKELPTIGPSELVGNIEGYPKLLQALQEISPVPVSFELIDGDAKGFYHLEDKKIVVQDGMSEVQTIKTLLHEMAHQKLHDKDNVPEAKDISRNGKEVEAESVAYVVCQHYGINTSDYSFSYVAGWSEGKETPELKASLDKIRQTASEFIYQIDQKMEVLMADKEQGKETAKVKESVKSKLKANTEKAEQAPKKSRTSKAKEERA